MEQLNNREIAAGIWLVAILVLVFSVKSIRKHIPGLLKAIFHWQIVRAGLIMISYVTLIVYLMSLTNFWNFSLLKDLVVWFLGVGVVMFFTVNKAIKNPRHFKEIIWENVKLTIYVEFIINLYVFSLPVELLISFLIILFGLLSVVGAREERHKRVVKFSNGVLTITGLIIVTYVIVRICNDFGAVVTIENLRSFLFPVTMTLAYIPFLRLLSLWMHYQEYFVRLNFAFKGNRQLLGYAKRSVVAHAGLNQNKLRNIDKGLKIFLIGSREQLDAELKRL